MSESKPTDVAAVRRGLRDVLAQSVSEEDLRIGMEKVLANALPNLPVPKYEKSIQTSTFVGRMDAVHQRLVIEYEKPRSMQRKPKRTAAVKQVCEYLTRLALGSKAPQVFETEAEYTPEEEERLAENVGLATDGQGLAFVQRYRRTWHVDWRPLDDDSVEKLLIWLRAMSRKDLSPENLIGDFGPGTSLAVKIVGVLSRLVASGEHPKANVLYDEWQRIFGIVYGVTQLQRPRTGPEGKALAAAYQSEQIDFPVVLFAVHTYYALLMKLLATEVIVAQGGIGDTFVGTLARGRLHDQLKELETGEILQRQNITNAIDQDFFGWYTEAWSEELHDVLWEMGKLLAGYDISTFELKPDRARDLLKDLYHGLIPETVRHALGEYYTPDWLAEHTIQMAGYDGNPHKSFLDPACGSGTFLVMAIQSIRRWLTDRIVEWGSTEKRREALDLIRHNVVGFDLNPLAVIASRTNYLFALGSLLRYRAAGSDFEIPVYLTDSVLLPGRMPEQKNLFAQDTIPFPMTVGTFHLPRQVIENHRVPDLMNLLHESITEQNSREAFVGRAITRLKLDDDGGMRATLANLFDDMAELDRQGKNRIWAKLIRNRYASLFFRQYFDYVIGNPPHVNWESLTHEWRKAAEDEYRHYGLFTLSGLESRHGGGKKDIAALFTYAVLDHFLKDDGILALVVHVSLFKTSGAGEGYRRFQLGKGKPFSVEEAHDFASFQPFQTHPKMKIKTRTLTFRAVKGKKTRYPVDYTAWTKPVRGYLPGNLTWEEARTRLSSTQLQATPLRGTQDSGRLSPWLTIPPAKLRQCRKVIAPPDYEPAYEGHAGVYTGGLNGAYFVEILDRHPDGTLLIRNMHDVGKISCPKVQTTIEADLVYPLLRGRSVARWRTASEGYILVVQDPQTQRGYPERWMQETHPLTWAYLRKFEKQLRQRKAFQKFFDPDKDPFYSMYAVGEYTMSPYKVAWMDISSTVKAAVIPPQDNNEMVMPEHTVIFLTTDSEDEAHYVAAVLNSNPSNTIISGYIVDNHLSTHPIENVVIPKYDPDTPLHKQLADLSRQAHQAALKDNTAAIRKAEAAINKAVRALW